MKMKCKGKVQKRCTTKSEESIVKGTRLLSKMKKMEKWKELKRKLKSPPCLNWYKRQTLENGEKINKYTT